MLKNDEKLLAMADLKYLRCYLSELQGKKQLYNEIAKGKGFIAFLQKICVFLEYKEFLQIDHMIAKISEIISVYSEITRPKRVLSTREEHCVWFCLSLSTLNSLLKEEASKDFYSEEICEISRHVDFLFSAVYERSEPLDLTSYK